MSISFIISLSGYHLSSKTAKAGDSNFEYDLDKEEQALALHKKFKKNYDAKASGSILQPPPPPTKLEHTRQEYLKMQEEISKVQIELNTFSQFDHSFSR